MLTALLVKGAASVRNIAGTTAPGPLTLTGWILEAECLGIGGDLHEGVCAWPWSLRRVTHRPGLLRMSLWPSGATTGGFLGELGHFCHPTLESRLLAAFPEHSDFGNVIQSLGLFPQL